MSVGGNNIIVAQCFISFILICRQDNKTAYEIALEEGKKGHLEVASMLADFKDNGPSSLPKYERKILRNQKEQAKENGVRPKDLIKWCYSCAFSFFAFFSRMRGRECSGLEEGGEECIDTAVSM